MRLLILHWVVYSLWFTALSSGLFLVTWLAWMTSKKEYVIWSTIRPLEVVLQKLLIWIPRIAGLSLAFIVGYGARDVRLASNQYTYTGVEILNRVAERDFWIWPERMKQQHVQLCPVSTVDWYNGELLDDLTFEQQQGCKRIISYREHPKGGVNVAVSLR